jgi:hypothetical protein
MTMIALSSQGFDRSEISAWSSTHKLVATTPYSMIIAYSSWHIPLAYLIIHRTLAFGSVPWVHPGAVPEKFNHRHHEKMIFYIILMKLWHFSSQKPLSAISTHCTVHWYVFQQGMHSTRAWISKSRCYTHCVIITPLVSTWCLGFYYGFDSWDSGWTGLI